MYQQLSLKSMTSCVSYARAQHCRRNKHDTSCAIPVDETLVFWYDAVFVVIVLYLNLGAQGTISYAEDDCGC